MLSSSNYNYKCYCTKPESDNDDLLLIARSQVGTSNSDTSLILFLIGFLFSPGNCLFFYEFSQSKLSLVLFGFFESLLVKYSSQLQRLLWHLWLHQYFKPIYFYVEQIGRNQYG